MHNFIFRFFALFTGYSYLKEDVPQNNIDFRTTILKKE
ncbi:hypothetical protein LEP1GSC052_1858 [Leptospira kmetyi serovar Malaysia str. Bejo-Iso9]|nr:hypothetical protein LEP1GSC052_1858 [Leptospira kmetyi serovar Malaysia str. Bejo-Iso9]